jgi:lysophospholipase L1-like esterase
MHSSNDAAFLRRRFLCSASVVLSALALIGSAAFAGEKSDEKEKWVASWAASAHGPYPGMIRDEFLVNSTLGTIDHLHPNRAGYLSMAKTIDIHVLAPPVRGDHP